jgi:serine/threonine-protein kinase
VSASVSNQGPDLTGRKIGEYEIVSKIGVGGMGAVYEGRQPLIGKRVAVKVLLPSLSGEKELVERFLSEARAVNEIRHRGIVDIFSFGQLPEGAHYFVMEYLEGEAFDRIIKRRAPLPLAEALAWTEETLDALHAAHQAGIIHRDIKPSNLFLVNTGRGRPYVKLLDFGIAKLGAIPGEATPQTRASIILGTPDYISPEQARGKPISPQTDLYAVGCVLFEMLTGQRLFKGENTLATMWAHVEDPPPLPSSLRPEIPPALDELILWALEKDPKSRPPSAEAMRAALEQVRLSLGPGAALTPNPHVQFGRARPQRPDASAVGAQPRPRQDAVVARPAGVGHPAAEEREPVGGERSPPCSGEGAPGRDEVGAAHDRDAPRRARRRTHRHAPGHCRAAARHRGCPAGGQG